MKRSKMVSTVMLGVTLVSSSFLLATPVSAASDNSEIPTYRAYNPNTGEHFYTQSVYELINIQKAGWNNEGIAWYSPTTGTPIYRIYNPNALGGDHYYTTSKFEAEHNVSLGWKWDNDGAAAFYAGGDVKTYVAYNPNALSGSHNYTTNINEQNYLLDIGWQHNAVAWASSALGTGTYIDATSLFNKNSDSIQGLWKNAKGDQLEVIGKTFYVNGKDITKGATKDIWDNMLPNNGRYATLLYSEGTVGFGIMIVPKNVKAGDDDNSDPSKDRIMIGQTFGSPDDYFYRAS
ncbi:MAG: hypothetical protein LBV19_07710 [Streptococcaceae bacterium]|jgi:hypothetical protein|nr:hypothetical protein [Streptococcaceae bacterium]